MVVSLHIRLCNGVTPLHIIFVTSLGFSGSVVFLPLSLFSPGISDIRTKTEMSKLELVVVCIVDLVST